MRYQDVEKVRLAHPGDLAASLRAHCVIGFVWRETWAMIVRRCFWWPQRCPVSSSFPAPLPRMLSEGIARKTCTSSGAECDLRTSEYERQCDTADGRADNEGQHSRLESKNCNTRADTKQGCLPIQCLWVGKR